MRPHSPGQRIWRGRTRRRHPTRQSHAIIIEIDGGRGNAYLARTAMLSNEPPKQFDEVCHQLLMPLLRGRHAAEHAISKPSVLTARQTPTILRGVECLLRRRGNSPLSVASCQHCVLSAQRGIQSGEKRQPTTNASKQMNPASPWRVCSGACGVCRLARWCCQKKAVTSSPMRRRWPRVPCRRRTCRQRRARQGTPRRGPAATSRRCNALCR